jgi:OmpA family protein
MKPVLLWVLIVAVAPWIQAQQSTSVLPTSMSSSLGLHTFPAKDQTAAQQQQDEMACYSWAKQDSGFDPLAAVTAQQSPSPTAPAASAPQTRGAGVQGAAGGAARGAVVGAIAGDAGKGAEVGAAAGAVGGRVRARRAEKAYEKKAQQQQQQQAQQQAQAKTQTQQKFDGFKKGFGACMEAKGYVVK